MESTKLKYGEYYHIYNRGNNGEVLFKEPRNYTLFIALYIKYIDCIADTLAYCLMSNHFHLVVRIKEESEIKSFIELNMFMDNKLEIITDKKPSPSSQFSHLFNAYTKSINKAFERTGSIFEHPFERKLIENELYIQHCIAYIHNNPVKHGFSKRINEYKWSSYNAILSDKPTKINRDLVLSIFEDREYFIQYHGGIIEDLSLIQKP